MRTFALATGFTLVATFAFSQECVHGLNQAPEQAKRERAALAVVRMINTMQAEEQGTSGRVLFQADLKRGVDADMARLLETLNGTFDKPEVLPGFELRMMSSGKHYLLTLTDTTDPCRFSFVSDERGMIIKGEAIR
jgi:hypothetical protein